MILLLPASIPFKPDVGDGRVWRQSSLLATERGDQARLPLQVLHDQFEAIGSC